VGQEKKKIQQQITMIHKRKVRARKSKGIDGCLTKQRRTRKKKKKKGIFYYFFFLFFF